MAGTWLIRFLRSGETKIRTAIFDYEEAANQLINENCDRWEFWRLYRLHDQSSGMRT